VRGEDREAAEVEARKERVRGCWAGEVVEVGEAYDGVEEGDSKEKGGRNGFVVLGELEEI
jgi:hypothetical protein